MKFIKILSTLLLTFLTINASELNNLYQKAQNLEVEGKYKEAMLLYKQIIKKERDINRVYIDEDKRKELENIGKTIDSIDDNQTYETIEQIIASKFSLYPYKENYFLPFSYDTKERNNRKQTEAKFQLSVKKPIVHNFFGFNETVNFGYTHTSLWQLYENSSPFRETNYKPEIFVTIPYGKKDKTSLKGFTLGVLQESNGQAKPESRSWNRVYLESYFQMGNLFLVPRAWYKIPEKDDDNPDLDDYMGYGDFKLLYPYKTHTFKLLLRNNFNTNKGFAQVDWTFPFFDSKNSFAYFQLSSGYGDSLIDYDKEINRISFGISLSR